MQSFFKIYRELKGVYAEHFRRRSIGYRRLSVLLASITIIVLGSNIFLQLIGAFTAEAANLSTEPISPAGIFFAPKNIAVGQKVAVKTIVTYLRNCGYSQVEADRQGFASGSYQLPGPETLHLRSDFPGMAADVRIEWSQGKITKLSADGNDVSEANLEPKPVTNLNYTLQTEEDVQSVVNFPVHLIPARNFELEGSTVKEVICSSEGRCDLAVSLGGIARASFLNAEKRLGWYNGKTQGGSTPCAQTVKNITGDSSRSVFRKIKEVYTCSDLFRRLTPAQIFQIYANHIYFGVSNHGQNIYGLETAAREIFGKRAEDLDLNESIFLAALIPEPDQLPKLWSKKYNVTAWNTLQIRHAAILQNIQKKNPGRLTAAEIESAKRKLSFLWDKQPKQTADDPYDAPIVQLAAEEFYAFKSKQKADKLALPFSELRILRGETSINEELQSAGQRILKEKLRSIQAKFPPINEKTKKSQPDGLVGVIALSDNETGGLLALAVDSTDPKLEISKLYVEHGVDPCSQIKPFTYSCALQDGALTLSTLVDPRDGKIKQLSGNIWQPSAGIGDHPKTVAEAIAGSDDGVAAFVAGTIVGLERTVDFYGRATGNYAKPNISANGQKEFSPINSLGFGIGLGTNTLEFLEAYSAFARGGKKQNVHILSKIYNGQTPMPPSKNTHDQRQILDAESAYLVFQALRGTVGVGPFGSHGTAANLPFAKYLQEHPQIFIGCKTGSGARNIGLTCVSPRFTVTVQAYYAKNSLFRQLGDDDIYAAQTAGMIWSDFMLECLRLEPELFDGKPPVPDGITEAAVDMKHNCTTAGGVLMPFKTGTEPTPCISQTIAAEGPIRIMTVDTRDNSGLFLRSGPSMNAAKLGFVPEGAGVELVGCDDSMAELNGREGRWCRIRYEGSEGFAWGWWIREQ